MINKQNIQRLQQITNREELITFLREENTSYSNFILERLDREVSSLKRKEIHSHHIIPAYLEISDASWNKIDLTIPEHAKAHLLLYENYKYKGDLGAHKCLSGQVEIGMKFIRQAAQETMRQKQIAFYSSATQRDLGSRPKNPVRLMLEIPA